MKWQRKGGAHGGAKGGFALFSFLSFQFYFALLRNGDDTGREEGLKTEETGVVKMLWKWVLQIS